MLFSDAIVEVVSQIGAQQFAFVEVGPGTTLKSLAAMHQFDIQSGFFATLPNAGVDEGSESELHQLLKSLWVQGIELDWNAHFEHAGPARIYRKQSLPLYPFDTKRHWVEPQNQVSAQPAQPALEFAATKQPNGAAAALPPTSVATSEPTTMQMNEPETSSVDRKSVVTQKLIGVFEDITGFDLQDIDPDTHFSEAGLDSLLLTQIATALQREFGGDISFRNLMEDYSNFSDLAEFYQDIIAVDEPAPPPQAQNAGLGAAAVNQVIARWRAKSAGRPGRQWQLA